jgi:LruC domain-containing protein/uncharacterized repeat protein (TIGR01451 family)
MPVSARPLAAGSPKLQISQSVSQEPLLGGTLGYTIAISNTGTTPITDRGYNLTITDTLPVGVSYSSASPTPSLIAPQSNGTTLLYWDNIADLEAGEALTLNVVASLGSSLTVADSVANSVGAKFNAAPDNSGAWVSASSQVSARPQAVDIKMIALQSTAVGQAGGAGEYGVVAPGARVGADWPFQYRVTVKNNKVGSSTNVIATATLPPGVAYLGGTTISPNPNGSSTTPALTLHSDGSLDLRWSLGTLTTARYADAVVITFNAAIPYRYRAAADRDAANGPFAGPMSGAVIPENTVLPASYEASANYGALSTADGSQSTPADDPPARVTAKYLTISKSASPTTVGIGSDVTFTLRWYVSEYYTATQVVLTDILPDGMTYADGSASLAPAQVQPDTPGDGQTTITWALDPGATTPGQSGAVVFHATVDPTYQAAPYAGQPVVSGDTLANQATNSGDWQDDVAPARAGALTPDQVKASVATRMPIFAKEVRDPTSGAWAHTAKGFTGDTMRFRLSYASAADVDARGIVIRDFLPRGMTYVSGSASHTSSGAFASGPGCASAPASPTLGMLNGLQYLEWRLCNAAQGSTWQATIDARIGDTPNVQPGWIVANFGKLTGQNTPGAVYSLRDIATTDYTAPLLTLTKSANPGSGLVGGAQTTFTISVKNDGTAAAYNLVVTDTLPANLLVPNSGGSASPTASSYTSVSGNPATGAGGVVRWGTVASLAPGATQTFAYNATIPNGLPAGSQMTNLASVAYNSRADNAGHQWAATTNIADQNTKSATVYVRGLTIAKSATPSSATIGDIVHWTLVGSVPAGVVGYWPVVQENSLPEGFAYLPGTSAVAGATLDSAHHAQNPLGDGDRELRWFLQTLDNTAGTSTQTFTLTFDTLLTGFKGGSPSTTYYPNNCCLDTAANSVYVGWYDTAAGYNSQGYAYDGLATNRITRRSPAGNASVAIRQPNVLLTASASHTLIGAGEHVTLVLRAANMGNSIAYDVALTDTLPLGMTLSGTSGSTISYPPGFPSVTTIMTDTNAQGTANLAYALDKLYVGATWTITATALVDPAIAAGLNLTNRAMVGSYSSQPGALGDGNGDGQPDERLYRGTPLALPFNTPAAALLKGGAASGELTFGSTVVYTLTVPATPINAAVYGLAITDTLDSRLQITGVTGGAWSGSKVVAGFASIPPNQQRSVIVNATLLAGSAAKDGDVIANQASFSYAGSGPQTSNLVAYTVAAPALMVDQFADRPSIAAGDTLSYTISVANVGSGQAEGLVLHEQLPANMSFVAGSARLDDQPLGDPIGGTWSLPDLTGHTTATLTFGASVASATAGTAYLVEAHAIGQDSRGQPIPADNHARVPGDADPDDQATAPVYGPLTWQPSNASVAFEDLKKTGWTDWDYNDLIVQLQIEQGLTPDGNLAAVRIAYEAKARGAGFDHRFSHTLPIEGGGHAWLAVNSPTGQALVRRSMRFGDDATFDVFAHTKQALPPPNGMHATNTFAAQTSYIPGYRAELSVVLDDPAANPAAALPRLPWDPFIYVYDTGQEVHLVMPGRLDNTQTVNTAFDPTTPLRGYDLPLAHVFDPGWRWPIEYIGIWRAYPQYAGYVEKGGTVNTSWASLANAALGWVWSHAPASTSLRALRALEDPPLSRYFGGPAVADLDGDGKLEIVLGNLLANRVEVYDAQQQMRPGWPQATGAGVKAAPALADLDGDGKPEVLAGAEDGKLYAWRADGTPLPGWPVRVGDSPTTSFRILATPAVADLDKDGVADVVVPLADGKLYAFDAHGAPKAGWPVSIGGMADQAGSQVINGSPRIVDLDGSGALKIVVSSADHRVYVFNANGSLAWSYLTGDMILGAPAVADFDPARPGQEIAVGSGDSFVYLLDKDGAKIWRRRTGWTIRSTPLAADLDGDGKPEVLVGGDDNKLWVWRADGTALPGWPQATGAPIFSSPATGDLDGDGKPEVVVGSDDAHLYAWHADGTPLSGWPRASSAAIKGTPVVARLQPGAEPTAIVGDFGGKVYALPWLTHVALPVIRR